MKNWRARNPIRALYFTLRDNAKRREIPFTLTWDYFKNFCIAQNHTQKQGQKLTSNTIDKIIDELGYADGNIQILTLENNIKKYYVSYYQTVF